MKSIEWVSKTIAVKLIDPTPGNYKIRSDIGQERLRTSLKKFGLAGNIVVTYAPKGRYVVVDGNSRLEQWKQGNRKTIKVSLPSRPLTPAEFREMSAMFDFAKAGEVDYERIEGELGAKKAFFDAWLMNVPLHLTKGIGKVAAPVVVDRAVNGKKEKAIKEVKASEFRVVQLSYTESEEMEFRKQEARLIKKWKTNSTMETVLKAMKLA